MKQLRMAKQLMIGAAVASMVLAAVPAAAAETTGTSASASASTSIRTKFPDVGANHWALQHVTKLAIEGIVEGNENGEYKPDDAVTQEQVLIMVMRALGADEEINENETTYNLPFTVSSFAQKYVGEALSRKLITLEEETSANGAAKNWGTRPATREWVAKIMVRMLGQETESGTPDFKDSAKISSWAKGYVNQAVKLGLVQGFEDGTFQPQGSITRAQMATFLSRSEKHAKVKSARYKKGYFSAIGGGKLVLQNEDGTYLTYNLPEETPFYGKNEGETIAASSLKPTYEVSILQAGGTAYYVELVSDQLQLETHSGSMLDVNLAGLKLYLMVEGSLKEFQLSDDVAVIDENGEGSSLAALTKNATVEVQRNKLVKSDKFTQIVVKGVPVSKTSEGTVQEIDRNAKVFKVLDKTSGQIETYDLSAYVNVTLIGGGQGDLSSLHVGDTVSYSVKENQLSAVTVTKQIDIGSAVKGTLIDSVNSKLGVMTIRTTNGELKAYELSDTVRVAIEGKTSAGLNDLIAGDELSVELLNNKVQLITVSNRSVQNLVFATITDYDDTKKFLTVEKNDGMPDVFFVNDKTAFVYLGTTYSLSNFYGTFSKGKKVNIQVGKDKTISSMTMATQLFGTISELNAVTNQMTIRSGGQDVFFKMSFPPAIELYGKSNATLSDLKIGDTVTIDLNPGQQDQIMKITATKTDLYKVLLRNANARQLTLQDANGTNLALTLDWGVELVVPGDTSPTVADIPVDEYVRLTFKGNSVTRAEVVVPLRGKVLAVDPAAGTVTVQDFAGVTQLITLGANASITGQAGAPLPLTSLKAGDRVQFMKDAADKPVLRVATTAQMTFEAYSATANSLSFSTAAGKSEMTMYSRAYLHQGTQTLTISSFAAKDAVTVYYIDNRVIEMEK
ncbi:S-layer homology domain-containing protein [Paenibacillus chartarius]|uniref:S-layer homology domain-containing protein n=1 Tax=Paenibacillus chartarius TaxID=747481 RepID=A0ABV6DQ50_9BACL